jgi:formyltetrahydrofolate-dependent phosphoribosylglycinamide formyltransferase
VQARPRIVVLASGSGTTLQAILDSDLGELVVAVGADRTGSGALRRAQCSGIDTFVVAFDEYANRTEWNRAVDAALADRAPDLVVLAGFLRILDARLVRRFRLVNTHPSLLPAFPGIGIRAVRAALAAGVTHSGATVHWVDEGVDSGAIIAQVAVPVEPRDDEHSLFARIQSAEKPLYVDAIRRICQEISP